MYSSSNLLIPNKSHPLLNRCVSWWKILPRTYGGGRLVDIVGQNHGKLINNPKWTGKTDKLDTHGSINYSPSNSYIEVPSSPSLDSTTGTWSCWFRTPNVSSDTILINRVDSVGSFNGVLFYISASGTIVASILGSSGEVAGFSPPNVVDDNVWRHVALSFGPNHGRFYVNGIDVWTANPPTWSFNNQVLRFGSSIDPYWSKWIGDIDGVMIHNKALNAIEIANLYNITKLKNSPLLIQKSKTSYFYTPTVTPSTDTPGIITPTRTYNVNKNHPINKDRVVWWLISPNNYGGGKVKDIINQNHGILYNSPSWKGSYGRTGGQGSINLPTTDQYVSSSPITTFNSATQATFAVWVYRGNSSEEVAAGFPGGPLAGGDRFSFIIASDSTLYYSAENGSAFYRSTAFSYSGWNRIVIRFDGSASTDGTKLRLFINGSEVTGSIGTGTAPSSLSSIVANDGFGVGRDSNNRIVNGTYDDVTAWKRALTPLEIQEDYKSSKNSYSGLRTYNSKHKIHGGTSGSSTTIVTGDGSAAGDSTATSIGSSLFKAIFASSGDSTGLSVGKSLFNSVASSSADSTALSVGKSLFNGIGYVDSVPGAILPKKNKLINYNNPLANGLISFWYALNRNTGSSKIYDLMGRNHGNIHSNARWSYKLYNGNASLFFDQSIDTHCEIPHNPNLCLSGTFTITFTANILDTTFGTIITKFLNNGVISSGRKGIRIKLETSELAVTEQTTDVITIASGLYAGLHRHCLISNSSGSTYYIDGVNVGSGTQLTQWFGGTNSPLVFGWTENVFNNYHASFLGHLDAIGFYNRDLTLAEIQYDYLQAKIGFKGLINNYSSKLSYALMSISASGDSNGNFIGQSAFTSVFSGSADSSAASIGKSLFNAVGSSSADSTATFIGSSLFNAIFSATGDSTSAFISSAIKNSLFSASGDSTGTFVGSSIFNAVGSGTGDSNGVFVGIGLFTATFSGSADSTATSVGSSLFNGIGSASGDSSAISIGNSITNGVGSASGDSSASGTNGTGIIGDANGESSASSVGRSLFNSTGASDGTSIGIFVGASIFNSLGSSSGDSTALSVGKSLFNSVYAATGDSTGTFVGSSIFNAVGSGIGNSAGTFLTISLFSASADSTGIFVGKSLFSGIGSGTGDSDGSGISSAIKNSTFSASGDSTATSVGSSLFSGVGSGSGNSTAISVGNSLYSSVGSGTGDSDVLFRGASGVPMSGSGNSTAIGVGSSLFKAVMEGFGTSTAIGYTSDVIGYGTIIINCHDGAGINDGNTIIINAETRG